MTTNVSIKLVLFSIKTNGLSIFLSNKKLPTVRLENSANFDSAVKTLFESSIKKSIDEHYFEQLYTISNNDQIIIVYYMLVDTIENNGRQKIQEISKENEDFEIISYALQRLRWKIEYTNVVYSLLTPEFTLGELQKTYEAILDKTLDKRNFRKKILSLGFLNPTTKKKTGPARPAQLYRFKERKPTFVKIFT